MSIRYDELSDCVVMRRLDRPANRDVHPANYGFWRPVAVTDKFSTPT